MSRKMKTVCNKNLDVFDFKDESPGVALRISSKLEKSRSSAIDKYTFLANAASGEDISAEKLKYVPSLWIEDINITHMATTLIEDHPTEIAAKSDDAFTVAEQPQSTPEIRTDLSESEVNVATTSASSPVHNNLKSDIHDLLSNPPEFVASDDLSSRSKSHMKCPQKHDEAVEMDSDENRSLHEKSSSSSPDVAEQNEQDSDSEDITSVEFYPDYVVYCDSYYTDSLISFTSTSIKLEASTTDGDEDDRIFKCKWRIEDIIQIRSHWNEQVEMAMVKVYVLTKDKIPTENVKCTSSVTELKFAVIGSESYGRMEAITSLNVIYKDIWTSMLESENTAIGHTGKPFSNYIPKFDEAFEEVVYPKGDADAVSISKRDFDLLEPDTFVNDTIIDFYIKYLKNNMKPEERQRFHFFNSFFFRKLADPDKEPLDAIKGRDAFLRVKKWTRKVNLFEKDYVFIPVNYNYHWSLIVICHLGDVATYKDEDVKESMRVPCVLHMDSIRGSHSGLKGLLQSYLKEEWKERNQGQVASEDEEDMCCSRFDDLRFISLELPQQQNAYDCGLFLLHYVQLFLEEAPLHFNPFKITETFNFLNVDWFPPSDASLKRRVIQKLICDLLDLESSSTAANQQQEQCHVSFPPTNLHKDDPCIALAAACFESGSFHLDKTSVDDFKASLTPIQEDVEEEGQFDTIQQDEEMILSHDFVSEKKNLETSTSASQEQVGVDKKRDCPQMVDDPIPTTSCMDMDMMMTTDLLQASQNLHTPTKKIRV